jgi:hypothetical protein
LDLYQHIEMEYGHCPMGYFQNLQTLLFGPLADEVKLVALSTSSLFSLIIPHEYTKVAVYM